MYIIKHIFSRGALWIALILFLLLLEGCASTLQLSNSYTTADEFALTANFSRKYIKTDYFTHTTYYRIKEPSRSAAIYIEGDGSAWLSRRTISSDPTPKNPLVLQLAAMDPSANVIYIARPGQYPRAKTPECDPSYWTNKRFSEEVVESINQVIDKYSENHKLNRINLIGYSGGGAIAVLIVARRNDIESLRTVAGNLDPEALNRYHNVSPLKDPLNPMEAALALKNLPQRHFAGRNDKTVPVFIIRKFVKSTGNPSHVHLTILDGVTHTKGWKERWNKLLALPLKSD